MCRLSCLLFLRHSTQCGRHGRQPVATRGHALATARSPVQRGKKRRSLQSVHPRHALEAADWKLEENKRWVRETHTIWWYSETGVRRPFKGPSKRGLCYQVVSLSRVIGLEIASLGPGFSCLLGQMVALSVWSPKQVLLYARRPYCN